MKLQKFEESNYKKKGIMVFSVSCVLLITGIFLYQSFALFQVNEDFNLIHGNVEDPGDLYFAYYIDDTITQDMPSKDSGYTLSEKSFCNNGVTITWDEEEWMAKVYYKNYKKENSSRTKCTLYFEEKKEPPKPSDEVKDYIIAKAPEGTLILDDETKDHNMRYIGANPNNYIDIGDRDADGNVILWRIIGSLNNIKANEEDEVGETRLKIIRAESIGKYKWDVSSSSVNSGFGVNEWSQADVMKLMNPGYEDESVGGSLYWNSGSGECYIDSSYGDPCDFGSTGLSENTKVFIGNAVWNTGSNKDTLSKTSSVKITSSEFYEYERSSTTGKICTSGSYCNDTVKRTTTWVEKVGLISPSDYGYATSGGETKDRNSCVNLTLASWQSNSECYTNNWLYYSRGVQWTMIPSNKEESAYNVFTIYDGGFVTTARGVTVASNVFPTFYLKSNVKIISGEGSIENPFQVSLN